MAPADLPAEDESVMTYMRVSAGSDGESQFSDEAVALGETDTAPLEDKK